MSGKDLDEQEKFDKDKEKKNIKDIILTRRNLLKLGIGVGVAVSIGYYSYTLLSKPKIISNIPAYYHIYVENGEAKALNIKNNSIDFQDPDHYSVIQNCLNSLPSRNTKLRVSLAGDFVSNGTIKIPSYTVFELDGSITIGRSKIKKLVQESAPGTTQIEMLGGIYRGDGDEKVRLIEFVNTTNSYFSSFTIENTGHTFGLTSGCSGNTCDKLIVQNSLNGFADRGNNNIWNDCLSQNTTSDLFIIKCKNSTFNRCIVKNGKAAGFGFYARVDGSNDVGAEISGNKFYNCQAINCGHAGFSLNCPTNGTGAYIHDNFIQAICIENTGKVKIESGSPPPGTGGLYIVNNSPGGRNENNRFDILAYNNPGGGITIKPNCSNNNCNVVAYSNNPHDVSDEGNNNIIKAFRYTDNPKPKIIGHVSLADFSCSDAGSDDAPFCIKAYCGRGI